MELGATNLIESGVKTHATKCMFSCVMPKVLNIQVKLKLELETSFIFPEVGVVSFVKLLYKLTYSVPDLKCTSTLIEGVRAPQSVD